LIVQDFLLALWCFLDWYFRNLRHGEGQVGLLLLDYRLRLVGFVESNVPIKMLKPAIDPANNGHYNKTAHFLTINEIECRNSQLLLTGQPAVGTMSYASTPQLYLAAARPVQIR
jgi:hypothetical protein